MSVVSARYLMSAEVYTLTTIQQSSGAIKRTWDYANPSVVSAAVESVYSRSMSVRDVAERWGQQYVDKDWAQMSISVDDFDRVGFNLNTRVGNVIDESNRLMFSGQFKRPSNSSLIGTVFDVLSINPVVDPFAGGVIEYQIIMAGVQEL